MVLTGAAIFSRGVGRDAVVTEAGRGKGAGIGAVTS